MSDETVNIEINGEPLKARKGQMVIEVADDAGIRIPRFCYHKKLSVAANCRMCLVELEKAPKPMPACATPVGEGMKVYTQSPKALSAQKNTMEFLLINHPLDCPICDQGGECELQDLALGFGRGVSRYTEGKRVVSDPDLGPLISTDMTRCIHCTRCVRFTEEVAGYKELGATGRGEQMRIGTYIEQTVDHELSGNVIDLCPVGALNNKPFRFRGRAWEMTQHAQVSPHDPVGSNLWAHVLRGEFLRAVPRDNESINETWIADRDRYSNEGIYSEERVTTPLLRGKDGLQPVSWSEALEVAAKTLSDVIREHGADQLGALAAPGASVEEHFLFQALVRGLGSNNLDHRLGQVDFRSDGAEGHYPWFGITLEEIESLDGAMVIGSSLRKEAPMLAHRVRKAALNGTRVGLVNPAHYSYQFPTSGHLVRHGAELVTAAAEVVVALSEQLKASVPEEVQGLVKNVEPGAEARAIAEGLAAGESRWVMLGQLARSHPNWSELRALGLAAAGMANARFGVLSDGGNSAGAALAGVLPHRGPGAQAVKDAGLNAHEMFVSPRQAYLLLDCEPARDAWDSAAARDAMAGADKVIALASFMNEDLRQQADIVLPVGVYAESFGTRVNGEGRWQSSQGTVQPPGEARPAWKILRALGNVLELDGFEQMDPEEVLRDARAAIGEPGPGEENLDGVELAQPARPKGLWRLGEMPIYAVDALVRRSEPLQQTRDGRAAEARLAPADAEQLNVNDGDAVRVSLGNRGCRLLARIDTALPKGSVAVPVGLAETEGLGPRHGGVTVERI